MGFLLYLEDKQIEKRKNSILRSVLRQISTLVDNE